MSHKFLGVALPGLRIDSPSQALRGKAFLASICGAALSVVVPTPELLFAASRCDQATAQSPYCRGETHFNDTVLDGLGTNGRACATCHVPDEAFQLSPQTVEHRYAALLAARLLDPNADDPLFRPIDADDFRTKGEAANEYSNLRRGLIRVSIPLPPNLRLIDPHTDLPSAETVADVLRFLHAIQHWNAMSVPTS
jgi:hypothetical protein